MSETDNTSSGRRIKEVGKGNRLPMFSIANSQVNVWNGCFHESQEQKTSSFILKLSRGGDRKG